MLPVPRVPDGRTIGRHQGVARHAGTKISMPGNGYCESFNGKLRDELLDREIFHSLREAQVLIEAWRRHYNTVRPPAP